MAFINSFFIPMITVYILYKLKKREPVFNAQYITFYMISCAAVRIITEGFFYILSFLFSFKSPTVESGFYSVVAVLVAVALPFVAKIFKFEIKETNNEKSKKNKKN